MKSMNKFIIKVDKPINDTIKTEGGLELYIDTKFNQFEHRVVAGEVVSPPYSMDTEVKEGDTLYFHHLVVIEGGQPIPWMNEDGKGQKHYYVNVDKENTIGNQAFAYKCQETGEIHPLFGWCLLEYTEEKEELEDSFIEIVTVKDTLPRKGKISFDSEPLRQLGVKKGDIVGFAKNMDYRVEIDEKEYYRVRTEDLLYVEEA